jgi:hypothetical protein
MLPNKNDDDVFSGILWKKHRKNQFWSGWHCRFFVLRKDGRLVYYKSARRRGKPRGGVSLSSTARIVRGTKSSRHNFYRFEVYTANGQAVLLAGETEAYANKWVDQLERTVLAATHESGSGMEVSDVSDPEDEEGYESRYGSDGEEEPSSSSVNSVNTFQSISSSSPAVGVTATTNIGEGTSNGSHGNSGGGNASGGSGSSLPVSNERSSTPGSTRKNNPSIKEGFLFRRPSRRLNR